MASTEPLIATDAEETGCRATIRKYCKKFFEGLLIIFLVVFILAWIVQAFCYFWATTWTGCTPNNLKGYAYPGGGGNASFNVLPKHSLLAERPPVWYGDSFEVIPSNEASSVGGAPVGVWWQTWGPIFPTYTYEDNANSQTTLYMRRKLLRIGQCHVIARCDGTGPVITFTEGLNWFSNRLRKFFQMNQAMSYKIYVDDKLVAIAEETQLGFQSMTFRSVDEGRSAVASSVLQSRHFHGQYDEWLVDNKDKEENVLPYYVSSATTLLFAFYTLHQDRRKVKAEESSDKHHSDSPKFLAAEVRNVSAVSNLSTALPVNKLPEEVIIPVLTKNDTDRFI
ncbi:unnamed protein product [Effrenium voratum]|nr:unnamed protein product [Effrenium voratum]|eukprot:CAMPEP_0181451700 /NCGR_PEP_ID=MMETSP1110-20121109/28827_1 /TAXON_ID=174948 /ORGANISM="Symbiodinium sp., Strain CCMP421" /LENGTH=336 /DNA_ID=CAMNT_0023575961 /DNA_START=36 /DNA_END=1046 /DNA_ORIENTATION=-